MKFLGTTDPYVLSYMEVGLRVLLHRQEHTDIAFVCSLIAHDRLQLDYKNDESSIGDREIPNDATTKTLEALGATFNIIDIWLTLLLENYDAIYEAYIHAMKLMFMQIPQTIEISLTAK